LFFVSSDCTQFSINWTWYLSDFLFNIDPYSPK
jgi:hypothetical protein